MLDFAKSLIGVSYDCEYLNAESAKRWHAALEPVPLLLSQRRRS